MYDAFDEVSLTLDGGLDLEHPKFYEPETRKMQGQRDFNMSGGMRYSVKNVDDVGEVVFPFTLLHGYKRGRETSSFIDRLEVDTTAMSCSSV